MQHLSSTTSSSLTVPERSAPHRYRIGRVEVGRVWLTEEYRVTRLPSQARRGVDEQDAVQSVRAFLNPRGVFVRIPLFSPDTPERPAASTWEVGRTDLAFLPSWTGGHVNVRRSVGIEVKA